MMEEEAAHLYVSGLSRYFARSHDEVMAGYDVFENLLRKWTAVQNLVSRETVEHIWARHIADSVQLLPLISQTNEQSTTRPERILDVGSGGGMPALPLAIALKGSATSLQLVEPIGKKVAFLRQVIRELELPASVHAGRTDDFDSRETHFDVITSRALAALPQLLGMIRPFFGPSTVAVLHKGRDHAVELEESRLVYAFDVVKHASVTDAGGVLLQIRNLRLKSDL